jgi:ribonuclease VapC
MIVVDSSVIVAVLTKEPEAPSFVSAVHEADEAAISAVNVQETGMVMRARVGMEGIADLFDLLNALMISVAPFDVEDSRLALEAFHRFGKGLHSKAKLNLGDCAAYALAKRLDAPLLFKGDDFVHTDVERWR